MNITSEIKQYPQLEEVSNMMFEESLMHKLYAALKTPGSYVMWENNSTILLTDERAFQFTFTDKFFHMKFGFRKKRKITGDRPMTYTHSILKKTSSKQQWKVFWIQRSTKNSIKKHVIMKLYNFVISENDSVVCWNEIGDTIIIKNYNTFRLKVQKDKHIRTKQARWNATIKLQLRIFFFEFNSTQEGYFEVKHTFLRKKSSVYMWTVAILMRRQEIRLFKARGQKKQQKKEYLKKKVTNQAYEQKLGNQSPSEQFSQYFSACERSEEQKRFNQISERRINQSNFSQVVSKQQILNSVQKKTYRTKASLKKLRASIKQTKIRMSEVQCQQTNPPEMYKQFSSTKTIINVEDITLPFNTLLDSYYSKILEETNKTFLEINNIKKNYIKEERIIAKMSVLCREISFETEKLNLQNIKSELAE